MLHSQMEVGVGWECLSLIFIHNRCSFTIHSFNLFFFHVTNCISSGFSDSSNRPPFSSSPWIWNFSKCSPKPPVSFCLHPYACLSPIYVEIPFLVRKSGNIYYSENSVSVLLKKHNFSVHVDLLVTLSAHTLPFSSRSL